MNPTCFLEDKILNIKDKYQINNYIMFDAIDYDELKYFYLLRTMKNEESYYKKTKFHFENVQSSITSIILLC